MKRFNPGKYQSLKQERAARVEYDRLRNGDNTHVRRLIYLPYVRVINVMHCYRLLSLDKGCHWKLLNHREYERVLKKCNKYRRNKKRR